MDRWRVVVAGIGVVLWGVGCGESEVRPGYSLPAEPGLDPAILYGQLDQQQSCLNRRPPDVVYCETFLYVPCDSTVREATPVALVPPSCDATTRARTGRSDAIRWCLVGPHIEPAPTDESQGDGWAGWCGVNDGWSRSSMRWTARAPSHIFGASAPCATRVMTSRPTATLLTQS